MARRRPISTPSGKSSGSSLFQKESCCARLFEDAVLMSQTWRAHSMAHEQSEWIILFGSSGRAMHRDVIAIELTAEERTLILRYGYPFDRIRTAPWSRRGNGGAASPSSGAGIVRRRSGKRLDRLENSCACRGFRE